MGDTSRHLTYFKVENFKRFESFEMKDLGQFNLIVGDNNVGKTSVLEALLATEPAWLFMSRLFTAIKYRNLKHNLIYNDLTLYATKKETINTTAYSINFYLEQVKKPVINKISLKIDRTKQTVYIEGIPNDSTSYPLHQNASINVYDNTPFVPFYKGHDDDLTSFYSRLEDSKQLKNKFIESLRVIVPDIDDVTVSSKEYKHLIIYQKHIDSSIPLAFFGDGAVKLFRLLAEIILNAGNRVMIDEIDTGIHYSRFKEFWRVILRTAKENDVQLFMTTHNEECIKYFVEVISEESMKDYQKDIRSITLQELPNKSIKAYTYSYIEFEANVTSGNELRGGF